MSQSAWESAFDARAFVMFADAGVGDAARPELAAAARPDYHALRGGLIEMRVELDKCRAAVRELTSEQ